MDEHTKDTQTRLELSDGRSRYNKIKRLLSPLKGQKLHLNRLKHLIAINIGTSERVIQETARFMIDTALIVERDHLIFEVMQ